MLLKLRKRTIDFVKILSSSIAFYPTLISVGLFLLAIYLVKTEFDGATVWLKDNAPFLAIASADAARTILATIMGGIISLTVFSFSMVMITLNQASTNFSPRILPGLVSEKKNQVVLGFYLGTTIFSLIVLLSIKPNSELHSLSVLSVLITIFLFIFCLALFIYFINHISTSIQIDNIMNKIYNETLSNVERLIESDENRKDHVVDSMNSTLICKKSSFYHGALQNQILKICTDYKVNIHIVASKGQLVLEGNELFRYDVAQNKEMEAMIVDAMSISGDHRVADTFTNGFSQLTEIGLKAMSPGINDPATAIITLNYLTNLFSARARIFDYDLAFTDDKQYRLSANRLSFGKLLDDCMSQYRLYCKENLIVMVKLKELLYALSKLEHKDNSNMHHIQFQIDALNLDAKEYITNEKGFLAEYSGFLYFGAWIRKNYVNWD